MARYTQIPIISTPENTNRRYVKVKYPEIPRGPQDIYVYTTKGDRYDLLAQEYYDSIYPNIGSQIRIPAATRISSILAKYETLNKTI
jgi:hypothetical protein